jgi:hypothetical protein
LKYEKGTFLFNNKEKVRALLVWSSILVFFIKKKKIPKRIKLKISKILNIK